MSQVEAGITHRCQFDVLIQHQREGEAHGRYLRTACDRLNARWWVETKAGITNKLRNAPLRPCSFSSFGRNRMRDNPYRRSLKKALSYKQYSDSKKTSRANKARVLFDGKRILPVVIALINAKAYVEAKIRDLPKRHRDQDPDDLEKDALQANNRIANFTIILAVVGSVGLYFNWRALSVIQGQLKEMQASSSQTDQIIKADNNLARAANDQAVAASNLAEVSERNIVLAQRAWIGPYNASIDSLVIGKAAKIVFQYQNSGRQPAQAPLVSTMKIFNRTERDGFGITGSLRYSLDYRNNCFASKDIGGLVVYPNNGFSNFTGTDFSDKQGDPPFVIDKDIISGEKTIAVFGCITYRVFEETKHSSFCFFYNNKSSANISSINICPFGADAN